MEIHCGVYSGETDLSGGFTFSFQLPSWYQTTVILSFGSCSTDSNRFLSSNANEEKSKLTNEVTLWTQQEKKERTFQWIVNNTCDVVVGPLEYCGNAQRIKQRNGKVM